MGVERTTVVVLTGDDLGDILETVVRRVMAEHSPANDPQVAWDSKQLADVLGVSVRSIPTLVSRDGLPHRRLGRLYRFMPGEVRGWLQARPTTERRRRAVARLKAV